MYFLGKGSNQAEEGVSNVREVEDPVDPPEPQTVVSKSHSKKKKVMSSKNKHMEKSNSMEIEKNPQDISDGVEFLSDKLPSVDLSSPNLNSPSKFFEGDDEEEHISDLETTHKDKFKNIGSRDKYLTSKQSVLFIHLSYFCYW